jgi:uncharacterized membrane protein (DUF373 family)
MSEPEDEAKDNIAIFSSRKLGIADSIVYAIIGISFLLAAIVALIYSYWDFTTIIWPVQEPKKAADAIIRFVSDLLLVIIIMEVLGTVIHYLQEHKTSLRPFLNIGIVSATRGILSISARLSVETLHGQEFANAMIELGVYVAVILVLGITLRLFENIFDTNAQKVKIKTTSTSN